MQMNSVMAYVARSVGTFSAESRVVGVGRSLIALAQISVLVFTPAAYLFVPVGGEAISIDCRSLPQQASAYCLVDSSQRQLMTWVLLVLLLVVASGLLPRVTPLVHFWVSLSINSSISLPDGGEVVAQVCTFFLILVCINDRRTWHWQAPRNDASTSVFQGVAWAGHWGLRLQLFYVYLNSSLAKVSVAPWQEGTATYYVARMENFGAAGLFADAVIWSTSLALFALATAWGAILVESTIAICHLLRGVRQIYALVLCVAIHGMIIMQLGIVSFGLVMVGAVVCATSLSTGEVVARAYADMRAHPRLGQRMERKQTLAPGPQQPARSSNPLSD